ncbi:uncharacterized protein tcf20 isoform X2 [Vanacampus margaritifer]
MVPEKPAVHTVRWLAPPWDATVKAAYGDITTFVLLKQIVLSMKITSHCGVRSTRLPRTSGPPSRCTWSSLREAETYSVTLKAVGTRVG